MKNSTVMIDSQEQDKWFDFAKVLAPCISVIFLVNSYIKGYFKDRASEREAALEVLMNKVIDLRVTPDIKRLTESIEKLNKSLLDIELRANKK